MNSPPCKRKRSNGSGQRYNVTRYIIYDTCHVYQILFEFIDLADNCSSKWLSHGLHGQRLSVVPWNPCEEHVRPAIWQRKLIVHIFYMFSLIFFNTNISIKFINSSKIKIEKKEKTITSTRIIARKWTLPTVEWSQLIWIELLGDNSHLLKYNHCCTE